MNSHHEEPKPKPRQSFIEHRLEVTIDELEKRGNGEIASLLRTIEQDKSKMEVLADKLSFKGANLDLFLNLKPEQIEKAIFLLKDFLGKSDKEATAVAQKIADLLIS